MLLQSIANSGASAQFLDVVDYGVKIRAGDAGINAPSFLFFEPYLAADYPEITCDKKYFFIYSTDHGAGDANGACYWGKGDRLDLADFEELGVIISGLQAETPHIIREPGAARPIRFFYHVVFDRGISPNNEQETRMMSTTGGELHTATWLDADPIDVLGVDLPQDHTGYNKSWLFDGVRSATHYKEQSLAGNVSGTVQVSTTEDGGENWNRGHILDLYQAIGPDRFVFPSYGDYLDLFGRRWWIGTTQAEVGSSLISPTRGLIIAKSNSLYQITEKVKDLNGGAIGVPSHYPKVFPGETVAHIYSGDIVERTLSYSTLDLRFLVNHV